MSLKPLVELPDEPEPEFTKADAPGSAFFIEIGSRLESFTGTADHLGQMLPGLITSG